VSPKTRFDLQFIRIKWIIWKLETGKERKTFGSQAKEELQTQKADNLVVKLVTAIGGLIGSIKDILTIVKESNLKPLARINSAQ
jgi:hypothetical protein